MINYSGGPCTLYDTLAPLSKPATLHCKCLELPALQRRQNLIQTHTELLRGDRIMAYTPESGGNQSRYQEHERADTNFDFDSHSFLDPSLLSVDQAHAQASLVATGNQSADYSSLGPVEDSRFRAATDISGPLHIDFVQERLPVASSESFQQANHGPSEHLDDDFFEAYSAEHGSRRIPPAENYSGLYTEQSTAPLAANNSNT